MWARRSRGSCSPRRASGPCPRRAPRLERGPDRRARARRGDGRDGRDGRDAARTHGLRRVSGQERRARLALRHRLTPPRAAASVVEVTRDLVALHATDPASVYLAAAARLRAPETAAIECALYEDRTLVRMLGMRRTMFVVRPSWRPWCTRRAPERSRRENGAGSSSTSRTRRSRRRSVAGWASSSRRHSRRSCRVVRRPPGSSRRTCRRCGRRSSRVREASRRRASTSRPGCSRCWPRTGGSSGAARAARG